MSKVFSFFTIATVIKGMLLLGFIAIFAVVVQSCSEPENGIERFGVESLQKLTSLETPPQQPSLEFISAKSGEVKTLQDYRGQIVLVNAWATWCPPCVAEMPSLNRLQKLRGGEDFQVVTISLDNTKEKITEFYTRNDITHLPDLHDGSYEINGKLLLPGLPTTVIYNRQGREVARLPGEAEWDSAEALALVDYLIAND